MWENNDVSTMKWSDMVEHFKNLNSKNQSLYENIIAGYKINPQEALDNVVIGIPVHFWTGMPIILNIKHLPRMTRSKKV